MLPFLLGDRLVARVDLKADRANSRCWSTPPISSRASSRRAVAGPLREELRLMADWLGLDNVSLPKR